MQLKTWSVLAGVAGAALVPPNQDPFYQPSGDWKSQKPGTILNHREVPNNLTGVTYSQAYQLLYRTVDALDNPIAAVTTVIIPQNNADYSKLLSYQIVYDTPDVNCSPSFTLQNGTNFDSGFQYPLEVGWIVNTPDYEGPMAAFTNGIISGQATLDSIRAALASTSITKVQSNATVGMWGYSGGSLASEWAAELQSSYAPELHISGTALGGLTPNVTSVALAVNGKADAGLAAAGILGIAAAYPNISSLINETLVSATAKADFYKVKDECISQIGAMDVGVDIFAYFTEGAGILTDPRTIFAVNAGGIMGIHGLPEKSNKFYVYKSILDEVSPIADTDKLVEEYCQDGLSIEYVKANYGTHSEEAVNGGTGAFNFLLGIMNGTPASSSVGCLVQTTNSAGSVIGSSTILPTGGASTSSVSASATGSASGSPSSSGVASSGSASASPCPTSGSGSGSSGYGGSGSSGSTGGSSGSSGSSSGSGGYGGSSGSSGSSGSTGSTGTSSGGVAQQTNAAGLVQPLSIGLLTGVAALVAAFL